MASVPLSKVPSVRQLCELLGIQHASLKDSTVFMDTVLAFRKTSTTSNGSPVIKLLDWNSQSVQNDLRSAAVKFLDENDNGHRFWKPTRGWAQPSDLHYPEHKDRIIDLLVQLFWKQNRYLHNNSYYIKPKDSPSRDGSADQSMPARESYEQSAISHSTTSFQPHKKKKKKKFTVLTRPTKIATAHTAAADSAERRAVAATYDYQNVDIFDVPESSDDEVVVARSFASSQTGKHSRNERPDSENEARKRKKHQMAESPRRTERKRNPRNMPWVAPQEEVNMILDMEETEAGVNSSTFLSKRPGTPQSDPTLDPQLRSNSSTSQGPAHTTSDQSNLSDGPFTAPTAPMIVTQRPTAPKSSLSTEPPAPPAPPTKVVRLKMPPSDQHIQKPKTLPPNSTAGIQSATSHIQIQNAASGGTASSGLETFSTRHQPTPIPTPAQYPMKAAPVFSNNDKATVSLGSAREEPGLSSLGGSLSTNDAYGRSSINLLTPSLPLTATSNAAKELPPATIQHVTPEPPIVSQATSQPSTPAPRSRIQIPFWIITREPLYTEELWNDGKFQGFSLADFLEGITKVTQRSQIEKIKLTLRTPFSNTILTVHGDAEDVWTKAKATFAEKLKESRAEARARRVDDIGGYKILIEPFYEQVITTSRSTEADDDVFDY